MIYKGDICFNELLVEIDGDAFISSPAIARLFYRRHGTVMCDIDEIIYFNVDDILNDKEREARSKSDTHNTHNTHKDGDVYGKYYISEMSIKDLCNISVCDLGNCNYDIMQNVLMTKEVLNNNNINIEGYSKIHKEFFKKYGDAKERIYYVDKYFVGMLAGGYISKKNKRNKIIRLMIENSMMEYSMRIRSEKEAKTEARIINNNNNNKDNNIESYLVAYDKKLDIIDKKIDKIFKLFEDIAPSPEEKLLRKLNQEKAKMRVQSEVRQKYIEFQNQKIQRDKKDSAGIVYDMSKVVEMEEKEKQNKLSIERKKIMEEYNKNHGE